MTQPVGRATYCQSKARYSWNIFRKISPYKLPDRPVLQCLWFWANPSQCERNKCTTSDPLTEQLANHELSHLFVVDEVEVLELGGELLHGGLAPLQEQPHAHRHQVA